MRRAGWILVWMMVAVALGAQADENFRYTSVNGTHYYYTVDECGDTLIMASLEGISVSSLRVFESDEDYRLYRRYRQYAIKVHPYAEQAIRIFRETEYVTNNMNEREARRYIRHLQRELKDEFNDPLRGLTKTQGMILIKMIERELDTPLYDLIKMLRNGLTATYWNTLGKLYGHDIREGYVLGDNRILDAVLDDFDVSYDMPFRLEVDGEEGEE